MKDAVFNRLPEFLRDSDLLTEYTEVAGEFLGDAKEAIEHFDYSHDYQNGTTFNVVNSLHDKGIVIPTGLELSKLRTVLRDSAHLIIKKGTFDELKFALNLIGVSSFTNEGWLPAPEQLRVGKMVDFDTHQLYTYDINRLIYTKLLYGDVVATEDGLFFEGYEYSDFSKNNKIGPLPILGERYENHPNVPFSVAKTPYVVVKIGDLDYDVDEATYTDPDTGNVYTYSNSEQFRTLNNVIGYFLYGDNRPTNQRIVVISSLQPIIEEILIEEEYTDTHTYTTDGGDDVSDSVGINSETITISGSYTIDRLVVGDNIIIGYDSPMYSQFSPIRIDTVSDYANATVNELNTVGGIQHTTLYKADEGHTIPLFPNTVVNFTAPSDSSILVFDNNDLIIETILPGAIYIFQNNSQYDYISFGFDNGNSTKFLNINTVYSSLTFFAEAQ